jgi:hypothetical protein
MADRQRRIAAGRKPAGKRKRRSRRRRRLSKPLRELRTVGVILMLAFGGLKVAALVLPHVS